MDFGHNRFGMRGSILAADLETALLAVPSADHNILYLDAVCKELCDVSPCWRSGGNPRPLSHSRLPDTVCDDGAWALVLFRKNRSTRSQDYVRTSEPAFHDARRRI